MTQPLERVDESWTSALAIVAHPDDEDGGMLAYESRGVGARTAILTLTRGEGGQNAMSSETYDALGLIRTNELLRADEYSGSEQYFARVIDYGFSKTIEEAHQQWGRERVLCDVVRVVRMTGEQASEAAQARHQRRQLGPVEQGHDEQRRTGREHVPVPGEPPEPTAGRGVLLHHGDLQAAPGEVDRGRQPTDAGADDDHGCTGHGRAPSRTGPGRRVPAAAAERTAAAPIATPPRRLLRSGYASRSRYPSCSITSSTHSKRAMYA